MSAEPKEQRLPTSPLRRLVKIGGLVAHVGTSILGARAVELVRSGPAAEARRLDNLVRNAARVAETLGEMKGAAMKVGQMLSLQESLLPPEVARVLQSLQAAAPRVPAEVMRFEVEGALGRPIDELFSEFEEEAHAAASIGQVHRGRMPDGRPVAVKIQYPLIREVVTADLTNLKRLLKSLFALVFEADFEPLWEELRDRLLEELDYRHEAENMRRLAALHRDVPEIVIPGVVAERSTDRVLTMELVEGLSPTAACAAPAALRDRWGTVLLELQLRGLLEHRWLHTDPNLANFAFREDGRVVVYDFGSVKAIPPALARAYAAVVLAVLEGRREDLPGALGALGLVRSDGRPLDPEPLAPYVELLGEILRPEPPYRFGEDEELFSKLMEAGRANWAQATDLRFPKDVIFVQRSLAGHFGNLTRLGATGPWRAMVERYARAALGG